MTRIIPARIWHAGLRNVRTIQVHGWPARREVRLEGVKHDFAPGIEAVIPAGVNGAKWMFSGPTESGVLHLLPVSSNDAKPAPGARVTIRVPLDYRSKITVTFVN